MPACWKGAIDGFVIMKRQTDLLEVVFALRPSGGLAGLLHGGEQQRDEERNHDHDHDHTFNNRYGLDPQYSQVNGWFNPNYREGKMSFSSDLAGRIIVLEYISDGLGYDADMKIPKLAEEALYACMVYAILANREKTDPNLLQRLLIEKINKLERSKSRLIFTNFSE